MRKEFLLALFLGGAFLFPSCASPDPGKVRKEEAGRFMKLLAGAGKEKAGPRAPMSLEKCLLLAMENSFALRKAALRKEIAALGAKAFSRSLLLPRVDVSLVHMDRSSRPLVETPIMGQRIRFPVMDKRIRVIRAEASFPLLDLSRWFLSAQAERGAEIQGYLEEAVRQGVQAEVTARYGALAALEASLPAFQARVEADALRAADAGALRKEGLALAQEADAAALALDRSRDALHSLQRAILQARRDLEQALGLPPAGKIRIQPSMQVDAPTGRLEDLVLHALLHRPELFASDRALLMKKEKARAAVADFLPRLLLNFGLQATTDSAQVHKFWAFGTLSAFVNLFEGLAGFSRLKGARREVRLARLERTELYGTVILQVARAYKDFQDAREAEARAEEALKLAREEADKGERLFREGFLRKADLAALRAGLAGAEAALAGARVKRAVAAAMLRLAVGPQEKKRGEGPRRAGTEGGEK